ncbi:hypothetical protein CH282_15295 [Rhodococcus sp. 06-418-1B]|nr:hypothetical protein [Rhodococcus sp. 06-418-1B]OZC84500.1 hypothetical protein CH282_15295 [Rhodococcus sp. 06-418-1B]
MTGSLADTTAKTLAVLTREQQLDDVNRLVNRMGPTELRAALIESVANTVELADAAEKKIATVQRGILTLLGEYALHRQAIAAAE